jgi:NAD(P)-dependent dehydrogenase (short-subunit alcohol dehydrogenase family)
MEIDTLGTFQMSRAAHPHLKRRGGGVVVNISATLHYGATFYQASAKFKDLRCPAAPSTVENRLAAAL